MCEFVIVNMCQEANNVIAIMSDYYRNKPQLSVQYLKSWDCKMIFVFNLISKNTQNSYESFLKQLEYFLNLAYKLQTFHFSFVGCCVKHLLLR